MPTSRVSTTVTIGQNGQGFVPNNAAPTLTTNTIINAPVVNPLPARINIQPQPQPQPQPQSYIPPAPISPPAPGPAQTLNIIQPLPRPNNILSEAPQSQGDCSSQPNTYWTGYRCACRVGYTLNNNLCQASQTSGLVFRPA